MRICILEADILHPTLIDEHVGYGQMIRTMLKRHAQALDICIVSVVREEYPEDPDAFDAYIVSGSKADAFGSYLWLDKLKVFLCQRAANGTKLLGICFGHQLLAILLGGSAQRAPVGWGLGSHSYRVPTKYPWMSPGPDEVTLLVSHQDQVTELPAGAEIVATSDFCPIAGFCIGNQILCFQGHPEFEVEYATALYSLRRSTLGESVVHEAIASMVRDHDGSMIALWMLRFIDQRDLQN